MFREVVESPSKEGFCWLDKGTGRLLVLVIVLLREGDGTRVFQSFLPTSISVTVTFCPRLGTKSLI